MHSALRIVAFSLAFLPGRISSSKICIPSCLRETTPHASSDIFQRKRAISFLFFFFFPSKKREKRQGQRHKWIDQRRWSGISKTIGTFRKQGDASEKQLRISNLPANQTNPWFRTMKGWAKRRIDSNFVRFICETLPRVVGKHGKRRRLGTSRTSCCASWLRAYASNRAEREVLPSSLHEQFHFHPWKMYANHPSRQPWRKSQGTARDNEFAGLSDFLGTRSC